MDLTALFLTGILKAGPQTKTIQLLLRAIFYWMARLITKPKYEIGFSVENIFNIKWNEAQFASESRLKNEPFPVTELNYTPGLPFFIKVKFAVFFSRPRINLS